MHGITEIALIESPSMREAHLDHVSTLDRVGSLAMLPGGLHATTELVAAYYQVGMETIKSVVKDHRRELEANGYRVLGRAEFERSFGDLPKSRGGAQSVAVFSRRTVLNVGMLLRDSPVARQVRTYLLEVEEIAPLDLKKTAYERLREKVEYRTFRDLIAENATDYAPNDPATRAAFADAQNILYRSVVGMTAAQILRSGRPILTWTGKTGPNAQDRRVAKNYLTPKELARMISRVTLLVAKAQVLSEDGHTLTLNQWIDLTEAELSTPVIAA